jgi:hypothetical protein
MAWLSFSNVGGGDRLVNATTAGQATNFML